MQPSNKPIPPSLIEPGMKLYAITPFPVRAWLRTKAHVDSDGTPVPTSWRLEPIRLTSCEVEEERTLRLPVERKLGPYLRIAPGPYVPLAPRCRLILDVREVRLFDVPPYYEL
jgi:hypothetical protein